MKTRPLSLVITVVLASGCAAGRAIVPGSGAPSGLPVTIRAIPFNRSQPGPGAVQPGTPVPTADIGLRAAAASRLVFGLARVAGQGRWDTYPAISTDGGRHWRIDGPRFHYPAAQGGGAVSGIGARAPGLAYVWGHGGNAVRVTTDAGRHWWWRTW